MVDLVQQMEPACQQAGQVFIGSVSRLLERLLGENPSTLPPPLAKNKVSKRAKFF
jgi:hypothetical protein